MDLLNIREKHPFYPGVLEKRQIASKILRRYSYFLIAILLILFEIITIRKFPWVITDFWEYSAVVKELSSHLIHPGNPLINAEISHVFYTPYTVLVALFSKLTGLNSIKSLEYFAIANLLFLLLSFYLFCKNIFKENYNTIATIGLIIILLLWGKDPPIWSGFYHIYVFHANLPYPSTFAMAMSLLVLSMVATDDNHLFNLKTGIIILLSSIIYITHPPTAIFLFVAIISFYLTSDLSLKKRILKPAFIIIPGLSICLLWPYYNPLHLLFNTDEFNNCSLILYDGISKIYWPLLLIIPGLLIVRTDRIIQFLLVSIILLITIYMSGYFIKSYGVSRLISNTIMFSQLLMIYFIVTTKELKTFSRVYTLLIIVAMIVSIYTNSSNLKQFSKIFEVKATAKYDQFNFLKQFVSPNKVVLSDEDTNWYIPSFSGKIIASNHPIYWIKDINERRKAVQTFFSNESTDSVRREIILKYQPDFILIDFSKGLKWYDLKYMESLGQIIYKNDKLILIARKSILTESRSNVIKN